MARDLAQELQESIYSALPLVKAMDVKIESACRGAVRVSLARSALIVNHIDAFHAGALYTFAETAAGAAVAATFDLSRLVLINKRGEIKYRKLVKERVDCEIRFSEEEITAITEQVEKDGKTVFPVEVVLKNPDGETVSEVVFDFYLKKIQP